MRWSWTWLTNLAGLLTLAFVVPGAAAAVRLKDITDIEGARPNQLFGMGLVVGLENTGGRSLFTQQVATDMLLRLGQVSKIISENRADAVYRGGNVSVVMVTAELGPFTRKGSRLDVTVSVLDDATSLQGGTLIFTPLRGADGVDYAVAQGPVSLGGFLFTVPQGTTQPLASAQRNHPTVGRIPGGALVEREARGNILCNGQLRLLLKEPDFNTSRAIAKAVNDRFPNTALTLDAGTVNITVPSELTHNLIHFVADIGALEVTPDVPARVVINERTGTIVAGNHVRIGTVAVAHGNLSITTDLEFGVSQPAPFARGRTAIVPEGEVRVEEQTGTLRVLPQTVTVGELARVLNALGATPRDLITILQAIQKAGALHAELIIM